MIKVTNIHKAFGGNQVLKGIDLTINKGKVVVILGPSGSGKTTFLRCLNALEIPDQGVIAFDDDSLSVDFATKPSKKTLLA
ncbi:ATP-binding cassette domain-containing protein, partial [Marinobacter sp. 1Y8]